MIANEVRVSNPDHPERVANGEIYVSPAGVVVLIEYATGPLSHRAVSLSSGLYAYGSSDGLGSAVLAARLADAKYRRLRPGESVTITIREPEPR